MAPWDVSFLNPELGLICKTVLCWDTRLYSDILLQLGWLSRRQSQTWQPVCLRAPPSFPLRMHPLGGSRTLGVGSALQEDKDPGPSPEEPCSCVLCRSHVSWGQKEAPRDAVGVKMGMYSFSLQFKRAGNFAVALVIFFPK